MVRESLKNADPCVKTNSFENEEKFCKNPNLNKLYVYVKSELKLSTTILLYNNDKHKTVTFKIALLINRSFQKVCKKDDDQQSFKLAKKIVVRWKTFYNLWRHKTLN